MCLLYPVMLKQICPHVSSQSHFPLSQVITRFTPRDRDCYAEQEIDLMYLPKSHGYRYEMSNCLFEAAYEKILERCHCAPG